jgi:hypothetical protein
MTSAAITIIVFIFGAIVGFFAQRFISQSSSQAKLQEQLDAQEQSLSSYKKEVAAHLQKSADLLMQMNSTCQQAMDQMKQSTELLQQATPDVVNMPFFSEETQQQLAATAALRHQKRKQSDNTLDTSAEPPLDYSGNPSGLFVDQKQTVTNAD